MEEFVITGGGCPPNAAIAIARLEAEARFVGPIGDDEHGTRVMDGLVEEGVAIKGAVRIRGAATSISPPSRSRSAPAPGPRRQSPTGEA